MCDIALGILLVQQNLDIHNSMRISSCISFLDQDSEKKDQYFKIEEFWLSFPK